MPTQTQPAPNPPAPKAGQPLTPRVIRLFQPYRPQSIIVILTILTTATLGVINPMLIQTVFDDGLGIQTTAGPNLTLLWTLGAIMITIAAINAALGVYQTYMTNKIGQYVMRDLRNAVYAHLQGMSLRFFTATRTGEIQSRVANDIGGIQTVVTTTLSDTIANLAILASTLTAMLIISWQLTIVAIATVPLLLHNGPMGRTQTPPNHRRHPKIPGRNDRNHPGNPIRIRHNANQTIRTPANRTGQLPPPQPAAIRPNHPAANDRPRLLRHSNGLPLRQPP